MSRLPNAFVTLLTDDSYLPGALVLLHSLHELHPAPRDFQIVCLVTPETVDAKAIGTLRSAGYDLVIGVEPISSGGAGQDDLHLMGRPDLNVALTKLHIFRLGSFFSTIIYLDADTLPIRPLTQLFESTSPHKLSACPDIGWPDCFNSGVMVVRPEQADFDAIRQFLNGDAESASGNGSFDGADQGLLNSYFSADGPGGQWNRLPFTYNVTPSAAYQYAPAYRHYRHMINLIHFIGPGKPWKSLPSRPSGVSITGSNTFDYHNLAERWHSVYDRYVRPSVAQEAKRFTVPETVAVWNLPEHSTQHGDRMGLPELKAAIQQGVTSLKPGQYVSLPLDGRVDLMMPKAQPKPAAEPASQSSLAPLEAHEQQHTQKPQAAPPQPRRESPEQQPDRAWDASRHAPPKHSQPEMVVPMNNVYAPAWDEPSSAHAAYFKNREESLGYPVLPSNVQSNDWYKAFTGSEPDHKNVTPLFSWETSHRQAPGRVFPKERPPPSKSKPVAAAKAPKPVVPARKALPPVKTQPDKSERPPASFAEAMASYTNAWDDVASINQYAKRLTAMGIGVERRNNSGLQTVPPSPKRPAGHSFQGKRQETGSDRSGDGDDEDEDDKSHGSYSSRLYEDKQSQTDSAPQIHAEIQASPETTPTQDGFNLNPTRATGKNQTQQSRSSDRGSERSPAPTPKLKASKSTFASDDFNRSSGSSSRSWDPRTDIDVRRKDSQQVLNRFMTAGIGGKPK